MSRRKQQDLFPDELRKVRAGFGGEKTARSNPTSARPFARNTPMHIVMRSELAKGRRSLWLHDRKIQKLLNEASDRVGARLMNYANSGNHLHFIVRFPSRKAQSRFLRAVSGLIARLALGAKKKTKVLGDGETFWAGRPFTRIVSWGRALTNLRRYIVINSQEQLYRGNSKVRRAQAKAALAKLEDLGLASFCGSG